MPCAFLSLHPRSSASTGTLRATPFARTVFLNSLRLTVYWSVQVVAKSTKCSSIDDISINYSILDTDLPTNLSKDEEFSALQEQKKVKICTKCVVLHNSAEHQIVAAGLFMDTAD